MRGFTIQGAGNSGDRYDTGTFAESTRISFSSASAANPGIKFGYTSTIRGLTFNYPDQSTTGPFTTYGATLEGHHVAGRARSCLIDSNTFINSYHAISDGVTVGSGNSIGFSRIRDNNICALSVGISIADTQAEINLSGNVLTFGYWVSGTVSAFAIITSTAVAIRIGDSNNDNIDGLCLNNNAIYGFNKGIEILASVQICSITGGFIDGCYYGIYAHSDGQLNTVLISGTTFANGDAYDLTRLDGASIKFRDGSSISSNTVTITGCRFAAATGYHIDFTHNLGSLTKLMISNCMFESPGWSDDATPQSKEYNSIRLDEGPVPSSIRAVISNCQFANSANQANSETVAIELVDAGEVHISNCYFESMKECVRATSVSRLMIDNCNSKSSVPGNADMVLTSVGVIGIGQNHWSSDTLDNEIASVAALPLPLSTLGDIYLVTGTADITSFTGGWAGRKIMLYFNGTAASNGIVDGTNVRLAGGANFVYGENDTITLVTPNGVSWFEISRSDN